jgi:integrase/recombinase XerD
MVNEDKKKALNVIHDYDKRVKRYFNSLKKEKTNNSKKILEYHNFNISRGLALATQLKYLERLSSLSKMFKKDFDKLTKEEMVKLIASKIDKSSNYSESTKATFKKIIKKFFQWLKKCEDNEYPKEVNWIKTSERKKKHKQPEELLNDEDIEKMIKVTNHPRDKAFIMVLAESGGRVSEVLSLKIGNLNFDDKGCYFLVNGKTGSRRVRVVNSTPFIHSWLDAHPEKENKDAPLWTVIGTTQNISTLKDKEKYNYNWSYSLTYPAARNILIRAKEKAGITKPINPHNFRHSRATSLGAAGLNESLMNQIMGWTQGSKMAGTYIHLSGKQTDDALLPAMYGMKVEEQKENQPRMFPIKCISCGTLNAYDSKRCKNCNKIIGTLSEEDLKSVDSFKEFDEMKRNIEFMKKVMKRMSENPQNFTMVDDEICESIESQLGVQKIK